MDREFLDGEELYWLDQEDYFFVVPGRKDMQVVLDARGLAQQVLRDGYGGHIEERVVVVEWEGKVIAPEDWVVYLTNKSVRKPLAIFDDYDERSIIENCLFKEAKQGWHIEHAPQKTFQALAVHVFFTLVVFALVNAYRDYRRKQDEATEKEAEAYGIQRWREAQRREARDKGIVFVGEYYGIFWLAEIIVLSGVRVKDLPKAAGTREEIFVRYKLKPK